MSDSLNFKWSKNNRKNCIHFKHEIVSKKYELSIRLKIVSFFNLCLYNNNKLGDCLRIEIVPDSEIFNTGNYNDNNNNKIPKGKSFSQVRLGNFKKVRNFLF